MVSSLWGCQHTLGFICELLVPVCHCGLTSKSHRLRHSGNYVWKPRPAGVKPWYLEAVPSWQYRSCAIGNLLRVRVSRFNGRGFAGVQQQPEVQKPQTVAGSSKTSDSSRKFKNLRPGCPFAYAFARSSLIPATRNRLEFAVICNGSIQQLPVPGPESRSASGIDNDTCCAG